jgi:hypothetical protein
MTKDLLERYTCFITSTEEALLQHNGPFSTLKILVCRNYSMQNITQVSPGKKVLDAPASNTDGFLLRDTCVPST